MRRVIPLLLCALLLCGCAGRGAQAETAPKLRVVATLFPYFDFARTIAGDRAEVRLLLAPGREAHSYEPTPLDAVAVAEADVFLYNGGEGEAWAEDLLEAVRPPERVTVRMMDCVDALEEELAEGMQVREAEEEDEDEVEYDEHIWTSPQNAKLLAQAVCGALCEADAAHADEYRANCAAYAAKLDALDAAFRALRGEAKRDLLIFADRFPLLYFCKEYGLRYRAAFHGCSSETEPSLATLKYLIDKVREEAIPVVYVVDLDSRKIAEAVSESTGAEIAVLYSGQTVSRADFDSGADYLTLMERDLDALRKGLT